MPQSLSVVYLHLVFSTEERCPFLRDQKLRATLHAYLVWITPASNGKGGYADFSVSQSNLE